MKKKVAVIYGGFSSEKQISVKSGLNVASVIDKNIFDVYKVFLTENQWIVENFGFIDKSDFSFKINNKKHFFDVAVIVIHGNPGENGILQSYFELLNIPYVSCNPLASAITFNKFYCNFYLKSFGINISDSLIFRNLDEIDQNKVLQTLGLPVFVKPNAGGSSFGTSKVKSAEQLLPACKKAFSESNEIMIEKFVSGIELTCAVVNFKGKIRALTPVEIVSKNEFFDFEAKYNPSLNEEIIPARVDENILNLCKKTSEKIYSLLNCNGIVRIDYIYNPQQQKLYFLELNSIPGMTAESIVPKIIRYDKLNLTEIYTDLILRAIERKK